eukprot:TRINITY_DN34715_c0_g1_i1.p1 TRINITY_DN34715_c0_g1~~TRINITY_DN34715_c0_g1_i1.p1  ORF type:complete len:816 (+),score=203.67 TRINITY_DN34715_c0_g1_i1:89-2449(+)
MDSSEILEISQLREELQRETQEEVQQVRGLVEEVLGLVTEQQQQACGGCLALQEEIEALSSKVSRVLETGSDGAGEEVTKLDGSLDFWSEEGRRKVVENEGEGYALDADASSICRASPSAPGTPIALAQDLKSQPQSSSRSTSVPGNVANGATPVPDDQISSFVAEATDLIKGFQLQLQRMEVELEGENLDERIRRNLETLLEAKRQAGDTAIEKVPNIKDKEIEEGQQNVAMLEANIGKLQMDSEARAKEIQALRSSVKELSGDVLKAQGGADAAYAEALRSSETANRHSDGIASLQKEIQVLVKEKAGLAVENLQRQLRLKYREWLEDAIDMSKVEAVAKEVAELSVQNLHDQLRLDCQDWVTESVESAGVLSIKDVFENSLKEVRDEVFGLMKRNEESVAETQKICHGIVDTALKRLEDLALRTRDRLNTMSGDLQDTKAQVEKFALEASEAKDLKAQVEKMALESSEAKAKASESTSKKELQELQESYLTLELLQKEVERLVGSDVSALKRRIKEMASDSEATRKTIDCLDDRVGEATQKAVSGLVEEILRLGAELQAVIDEQQKTTASLAKIKQLSIGSPRSPGRYGRGSPENVRSPEAKAAAATLGSKGPSTTMLGSEAPSRRQPALGFKSSKESIARPKDVAEQPSVQAISKSASNTVASTPAVVKKAHRASVLQSRSSENLSSSVSPRSASVKEKPSEPANTVETVPFELGSPMPSSWKEDRLEAETDANQEELGQTSSSSHSHRGATGEPGSPSEQTALFSPRRVVSEPATVPSPAG